MMLQLARRGPISSLALKRQGYYFPSPAPASTSWGNGSVHAQAPTHELEAQLTARNLITKGKRSDVSLFMHDAIYSTSYSQSTFNEQGAALAAKRVGEVPEMPNLRDFTEQRNAPIRVPLTPENKFARYHRHEVVPTVAPPHIPEVTTVLPDASNVVNTELTDILETISVEAKTHKTLSQYEKERNERNNTVKYIIQDITDAIRSASHAVVSFPVDLAKDMIEDVFSDGKQYVKEERQQRKEGEGEREEREGGGGGGPQVLTEEERTTLYTIGGLSVVWYYLGW